MAEDPLLIPPVLSSKRVSELVQGHYAISNVDPSSIKLLDGYEDRNYYLKGRSGNSEGEEYVFKVMNKKDSQFPEFFDALSKLMFFIKHENLTCSLPVQPTTVPDGTFIVPLKRSFILQSHVEEDCTYVGMMLTYLPGQTMAEIERSPTLLYDVGKFVGKLITSLQGFSHPYFETRYLSFDLKNFPEQKPCMKYIDTEEGRKMIEEVFRLYSEHVQPKMAHFKRGAVHNDLNCDNFICVKQVDGNSWKLSGLIDVMDTIVSCSIFDGAIFIAHMMMEECTNPLEYTEPAMSGYLDNHELNNEEFDCLYYLVASYLSQMFLESSKSYSLYPENSYRARFMEKSYTALKKLLDTPKDKVDKLWQESKLKTIADF